MPASYIYRKIDHGQGGNSAEIIVRVRREFLSKGPALAGVRKLAEELAALVILMAPLQQKACDAVCPGCTSGCCINRHAYHEHEDIVYLGGLGAEMPSYREGVPEADPCQFLGQAGCTISRHLRPHRCNSYFCTPLLEYLQSRPAAEYRQFISDLEQINRKREQMLEELYEISGPL